MCLPDPANPRSGVGKWQPATIPDNLNCQEGHLNLQASRLLNNETRVTALRDEWIGSIDALDGPGQVGGFYGWSLGDKMGETYQFRVQAFDDHNQPRDYTTLTSNDYVSVEIARVSAHLLPSVDQSVQPPEHSSARGIYPYVIDPVGSKTGTKELKPAAGTNGFWDIKHKFTEHGVFSISVYICPTQMECYSKNSTFLVEDSGPPTNGDTTGGEALRSQSLYIICPQGTQSDARDTSRQGVLQYNKNAINGLTSCRAQQGYFSPAGPGSIAEKCKDGYDCDFRGMYWPVAKPGYWIDLSGSGQRIVTCDHFPGTCPGSTAYGIPGGTWDNGGCWRTDDNATQFTDFTGAYINANIRLYIQNDIAGGSDCFMTSRYIETTGKCTHTLDADCKFQLTGNVDGKQCYGIVGSRCCAGATTGLEGGCSMCCNVNSRGGPAQDSCDEHAYHNDGSNICVPCPPNKISTAVIIFALLLVAVLLQPIKYCINLASYAGTAQGPFLSVLNFFQSSDLFNHGLKLNWPLEFKNFCTRWATLLNFNITAILHRVNFLAQQLVKHIPKWMRPHIELSFPSPDCAFSLSYATKWYMAMLSPIAIAVLVFCSQPLLYTMTPLWKRFAHLITKWLRWVKRRCCCCCCCGRGHSDHGGQEHAAGQKDIMDRSEWPWFFWMSPFSLSWSIDGQSDGMLDLSAREDYTDDDTIIRADDISKHYNKFSVEWACIRGRIHVWNQWPLAAALKDKDELYRGFQKACTKTKRLFTIYLMVGYLFLAGTALEPLACVTQPNGKQYISKNPDTPCDWCNPDYARLASWAYVCFSLYGLGIPLLFFFILSSNREKLHTQEFGRSFGFLSTKMRVEFYWWEVFISFRKAAHVVCTHFSVGYEFQFAMFNLFVTWLALSLQLILKPFAHWDANLAETLTLTATFLVLLLGIAHATDDFMLPNQQYTRSGDHSGHLVVSMLDRSIYIMMGLGVGTSVLILIRRVNGARFNAANHEKVRQAARADSMQHIPNSVRLLVHKRKIELAKHWAAGLGKDTPPEELGKKVRTFEAVLKRAEKFRNERLGKFTSKSHIHRRNAEWESFFPEEYRPMMMAWAAHQEAELFINACKNADERTGTEDEEREKEQRFQTAKENLDALKGFMGEVNELQAMQDSYFCNCGFCVPRRCKCCRTHTCCIWGVHWWLCVNESRNGWGSEEEISRQSTEELHIKDDVLPFDRFGKDEVTRDGTKYLVVKAVCPSTQQVSYSMKPDRALWEDKHEATRKAIQEERVSRASSLDVQSTLERQDSGSTTREKNQAIESFLKKKRDAATRWRPTWSELKSLTPSPRILRNARLFQQWFATTFLADFVLVHTSCKVDSKGVTSKESSMRVVEKQEVEKELDQRQEEEYKSKLLEVHTASGQYTPGTPVSMSRLTVSEKKEIRQQALDDVIPGARGITERDGKFFRTDYEWWYTAVDEFGEYHKVFFNEEDSKSLTERISNLERYPWSSSHNCASWCGATDGLENAIVSTRKIDGDYESKQVNLSYAVEVITPSTHITQTDLDDHPDPAQSNDDFSGRSDCVLRLLCIRDGFYGCLRSVVYYTLAIWTRVGGGFPRKGPRNEYKVYIRSHLMFTPSDRSFFLAIITWMVTFFFVVRHWQAQGEILDMCQDLDCQVLRPDYDQTRSCDHDRARHMGHESVTILVVYYMIWFTLVPVAIWAWHLHQRGRKQKRARRNTADEHELREPLLAAPVTREPTDLEPEPECDNSDFGGLRESLRISSDTEAEGLSTSRCRYSAAAVVATARRHQLLRPVVAIGLLLAVTTVLLLAVVIAIAHHEAPMRSISCDEQPCGEHGTCTTQGGDYTCTCESGWSGARCEVDACPHTMRRWNQTRARPTHRASRHACTPPSPVQFTYPATVGTNGPARATMAPTLGFTSGDGAFTAGPAVVRADDYDYMGSYMGGVLLPDGRVVFVPCHAAAVGLYDPGTNAFVVGPAVVPAGDYKYIGGVLLPDGCVVFVPANAAAVGLYDPGTNVFAVGPAVVPAGDNKYVGGVLLPDGRVVFVPEHAAAVGLYDPATNAFVVGPAAGPEGRNKYIGGVLLPDGRVVLVPLNATAVGLYDPRTNGSTPAYALSRAPSAAMNVLLLPYVNTL
jgi:hypothetical protein